MKVGIRNQEYMVTLNIKDDMAKAVISNDTAKQALINNINQKYETSFVPADTEVIDLTGKHLCKYCGEIANGPDEDILCEDCRYTFGHTFYSEL